MATVINDYKKEFVVKRLPQTFFGGMKLKLGYDAPIYVYINQVLIFILPFVIGGIFTLLVEFDAIAYDIASYIYGSIIFLFVLLEQLFSSFNARNSNNVRRLNNVFTEEDEIEFDSCFGSETIDFVLPVKKFKINIIIHSLLSGPLCGIGLWYLLPSTLESLYHNVGATVVLFMFGWFTICVAQYSLTVTSPPEIAIFRSTDPYELQPLMRPLYVYIFLAFHVVQWYDDSYLLVNQILHVVFIFLPLLWSLAVLPPLDALLLWLMEQCLSILGGSPVAGDLRLILLFLASSLIFIIIFFTTSVTGTTIHAAYTGYILSLDHASLANKIISAIKKPNSTNQITSSKTPLGFGWDWGVKEVIFHIVMLSISVINIFLAYLNVNSWSFNNADSVVGDPDLIKALGYVIIGLTVLVKMFGSFQSVYTVFGMWRNNLYPHSIFQMEKYSKAKSRLNILALLRRIILDFIAPVIMVQFLGLSFMASSASHTFILALGIVRALRWVWQGTFNSMVEISIVHIINQTFVPTSGSWYDLGLGPQLLLVGLIWNRSNSTIDKIYCYLTVLISSHTYEKQRPKHSTLIIALSAIFFPFILLVIYVAAFLSAPLLPLFTLPIILIGFPRPIRSWPGEVGGSANTCQDTVYYSQLSAKLTSALKSSCNSGSLGNLTAGSHFLARFQDRIIWLQVLECGFGFCYLSIKGMELQETSCHTEEAAKIDDMFERSFEKEGGFPFCFFNEDFFHVLTPVDAIPVDTYSSAKTVLTGLIDSPDTLRSIGKNFWKSLTWVLLQHIAHRGQKPVSRTTSPSHVKGIDRGSVNSRTVLVDVNGKMSQNNDEKDSGRATGEVSRPVTASSHKSRKSLASSWGSLNSWNDDDSLDNVAFEKSGNKIPLSNISSVKKEPVTTIPGVVDSALDDDLDDFLKDFATGLPPVDTGDFFDTFSGAPIGSIKLAGSIQFSSPHSSKLSLPLKWRDIPLDSHQISNLLCDFPKDWYRHVIEHLDLSSGVPSASVVDEIMSDEALTSIYVQLISAIFSVVNVLGLSGVDFVSRGPMHVFKVFSGDIPWSLSLDWLSQDEELFNLVIKAYRFAVKMSFDEVVYGEASDNDEVREYLEEYKTECYMGLEDDAGWAEAVLQEKPKLFSMGCDTSSHPPIFTSHILTRQPVMISIGRLNGEIVRALWASLAMELFYCTNDDEERYSIQAHPSILRNLTVQAADPPLGYPIFYSKPVNIPTL
ncbi:pecanex-like protein 4 [Antedon mediterranea]|uniref:pecanex-like protein 4 n=1 Tax=Antedon mediterranea TaxID=105859 RepID=UPI003AF9C1D8